MKDFSKKLCGLWIDEDNKAIYIEKNRSTQFEVSILLNFFELMEKKKIQIPEKLKKLHSEWVFDEKKEIYKLRIEVGLKYIGPTYNLYVSNADLKPQIFSSKIENLKNIRLIPEVQMGLYDDWDDDLGIPWAFPYKEYKKASMEMENEFLIKSDID